MRVIDGDTVVVAVDGRTETVRLIGINTAERGECMAGQATRALERLVAHAEVGLDRDLSDRDQYGRLLRYVYVEGLFVNHELVLRGLAISHRYEPDTSHAELLDAAQLEAQEAGLGMWNPSACGPALDSSLTIASIHYDAAGNDNDNLNDEWIAILNQSNTEVDLSGWSIKDESTSHRYRFPEGYTLEAGGTVTIHTGAGLDQSNNLFWGQTGSAVWNNSGDTGFLLDPSGNVVAVYAYP